ncbi:MAG TPA: ATP-binding protein [Pyrinomonadaceae bacterium]|jgi:signal transduction histidine kinase/ActR/RegA family two-component response regulator|nr:ATP-binding protein [Pyrinomonadaceae bacterium]
MQQAGKQRFAKPYMMMLSVLGLCAVFISLNDLSFARIDVRFMLLAVMTLTIGAQISIKIPRVSGHISVSDTFIFLTIFIFGGEAAVLLATLDGMVTSLRISKKTSTLIFNGATMAVSTFATFQCVQYFFGDIVSLTSAPYSPHFVLAASIMASVQYVVNSGTVAIAGALKYNEPFWDSWRRKYLWTSLTYITGASAAAVIAKFIGVVGFYAFIGTLPFICVVYFTYVTYMKNVEASAAQAEQAERHVAELSHYITEQERLRQQFAQLEKLSALGELASGVAHDFNNTLAGILGRAQLMLRTGDREKLSRGLEIIIKTAEDGAKTVKRIQDFARQRRDHDFAPVSVDQLLFDVSEMTRPRWKDNAEADNIYIRLNVQVNSKSLVRGDESELREVLVNMVFNAVDAMPAGGTLTLATDEDDEHVIISVSDTGCGMTPEVRSRIFDPFFTTKGKAGNGLGLAVSYGIILRHEGTIEVASEAGRGSTFHLKLPLAKGASKVSHTETEQTRVAAATAPSLLLVGDPARARILVVDDEPHVRALLCEMIQSENCEAVAASGGAEALALFGAENFDAVFTDIGMPGMSGWELSRLIRELNAGVPLAVITGWGDVVGSNEQEAAHIDWVVTKPFSLSRITEIIEDIKRRKIETRKSGLNTVAA